MNEISSGVIALVDPAVKDAVLTMLDATLVEKGHVQTFELSPDSADGKSVQRIIQFQDKPPYRHGLIVYCDQPVDETLIAIIEKGTVKLMLVNEV